MQIFEQFDCQLKEQLSFDIHRVKYNYDSKGQRRTSLFEHSCTLMWFFLLLSVAQCMALGLSLF